MKGNNMNIDIDGLSPTTSAQNPVTAEQRGRDKAHFETFTGWAE